MTRTGLILASLFCLAFLALLAPFVMHPTLYTIKNDSVTLYQVNPAALSQVSREKSEELQGLMQDILDSSQPVVLNIKIHDFEEAERAFDEYKEKTKSFDNLVVSLELSESAVGQFKRENAKNSAAMERLINQSAQFSEVNSLEIKYRSDNNPGLVYTAIYEGEALQEAINKTTSDFRKRSSGMVDLGQSLGLNTTRYEDSVKVLNEIMDADRARQTERATNNTPVMKPAELTLSVLPATGTYGDTLQVRGVHSFMQISNITLFLDSREWLTVRQDENGIFRTTLPIRKIRAGPHILFANDGWLDSNIANFTVDPADAVLTLAISRGSRWDELTSAGKLTAGDVPVSDAPVRILVDDTEYLNVTTLRDGTFTAPLTLDQGTHTLQAVFDGEGYPINPSASEIRTVSLAPAASLPMTLIAVAGFVGIASVGAVLYIRRRSSIPALAIADIRTSASTEDAAEEPAPGLPLTKDVLDHYHELVAAGSWSDAARELFRSLTGRLFTGRKMKGMDAKTPRELTRQLAATSFEGPFRSFVGRYEEVRYGGFPLRVKDALLSHWSTIMAMLEDEPV